MLDFDEVFAWIAIGVAAAIAGNLWHARRDAAGVALKFIVGPLGAVLAGYLATRWFPYGRGNVRLLDAAFGAVAALLLLHGVWEVVHSRKSPGAPDLERDAPGNKILPKPVPPAGPAVIRK